MFWVFFWKEKKYSVTRTMLASTMRAHYWKFHRRNIWTVHQQTWSVLHDEVPDVFAGMRVNATGGFIQHDGLGTTDEGQSHAETTLHATWQVDSCHVLDVPQIHIMQQSAGEREKNRTTADTNLAQLDPVPTAIWGCTLLKCTLNVSLIILFVNFSQNVNSFPFFLLFFLFFLGFFSSCWAGGKRKFYFSIITSMTSTLKFGLSGMWFGFKLDIQTC